MLTPQPGTPCDEYGHDLPPNAPPPPRHEAADKDNWDPYRNRLEFESADFLFRRVQMPQAQVDVLMQLWSVSLLDTNKQPPFADHEDMLNVIDATQLGDAPWNAFSISYSGERPAENIPEWMTKEYECWFRDPRTLVHQILANADFDGQFDYAAYQEFDASGKRRYKDFMSANFAWETSVRHLISISFSSSANQHI